jgi:NAD(P)H-quinone oxidoreductase subunit K
MFSSDSHTSVRGVDKLFPVEIYIPGCPPRPEAIMDAMIKLRKKIANESMQERGTLVQTHRYYTTAHKMRVVAPVHDGVYLQEGKYDRVPPEIAAAMSTEVVPPALLTARQSEIRSAPQTGI